MAPVSVLSRRRRASRFQLLDRQLSAPGQRADRRRAALDLGPPRHDNASLFRDRLVPRRAPCLARRAALDALADAAALGVARDPVLSARVDPDLSARLSDPAPADLRRLFRRRLPRVELAFRHRRAAARAVARLLDYPCRDGRMGARHARHDGDDNGRGLRHLRRGERVEGADRLSALLPAQRNPAAGYRARPCSRPDPVGCGLGRGHLRLSRHRHAVVSGDPRERPFRDPGRRLHSHRRARLHDLRARRDLSLARSPHLLPPSMMRGVVRYLRRNPSLALGTVLLVALALFVVIGGMLVDIEDARPLSAPTLRAPSGQYPFGTDRQGRDLLAVMIAGTPLTLRIGFIAGFLGVGIGTVLAFIAAYYRGLLDTVIRGIADIGLTVPGLLVLIIIAVSLKGTLTVNQMAIVVASLAWLYPTRTIRAQVLSLRERGYVEVARLSGMSGPAIIFFELMPNLLPYLAATLVNAVSAAILASIGLEVLGLGPIDAPTLGMTLYWVNFNAAMINGWWWWWLAPTVIILMVFLGLFFLTVGLDEIANPRLRRTA